MPVLNIEDNIEICLKCGMIYDIRKPCPTCALFDKRIA